MRWYHYLKILGVIIAISLVLYIFKSEVLKFMELNEKELSRGTSVATIVGGFIGVTTLILIWVQLLVQNSQSRLARTYEFSEKLQKTEFITHLAVSLGYFGNDFASEDGRWNDYINGKIPDTARHVFITLAYFEDLAMMYNKNYIDRELIRRLLKTIIIRYYEKSEWFRKRAKANDGESIYIEWDNLYKKLTCPCQSFGRIIIGGTGLSRQI